MGRSPSSIDNFRQKHDQLSMMLMSDAMVAPMPDINSTRKPPSLPTRILRDFQGR